MQVLRRLPDSAALLSGIAHWGGVWCLFEVWQATRQAVPLRHYAGPLGCALRTCSFSTPTLSTPVHPRCANAHLAMILALGNATLSHSTSIPLQQRAKHRSGLGMQTSGLWLPCLHVNYGNPSRPSCCGGARLADSAAHGLCHMDARYIFGLSDLGLTPEYCTHK